MSVNTPANREVFETLAAVFARLPHCKTLGFEYVGLDGVKPTLKVEWRPDLVGNPATGVVHGGVITSLVDTTSAIAVSARLAELETIATLDLRIDYLKAATPGRAIFCTAECYRLAGQVGFTRAVCYHDDANDPIAHGVATFMRESTPLPIWRDGGTK
ncbi:uncharacterized protein (TIGR00369 family) [Crenobacter luteus]|uniref:Thioesterase n=1 Tax=Crenobacter luteus TaxID=1452487 RepID=A0A163D9K4_9NEIS|nr:PaaI family thioesterase [Crenobacter luteus]KZE34196.1 thioesterase [Crenobacter luteus]TCP11196.1 uncharacterized protein (TIGR00369 family) [Crenobacter luteus]